MTDKVEQSIRDKIDAGELPGGKLPSERVLATDLGVGRTTVRLALLKLTAEGLIRAEHGRGYFANQLQESQTHDEA